MSRCTAPAIPQTVRMTAVQSVRDILAKVGLDTTLDRIITGLSPAPTPAVAATLVRLGLRPEMDDLPAKGEQRDEQAHREADQA